MVRADISRVRCGGRNKDFHMIKIIAQGTYPKVPYLRY